MTCLNHKAFTILVCELEHCAGNDPMKAPQKAIVLQRLQRLRQRQGEPCSVPQLQAVIQDLLPEFRDSEIRRAVRANQPPGAGNFLFWGMMGIAGVAGLLYVINLPYPMIRWPVAKTAPLLLLPSYLKMDYDYRGAIAYVEQADQLVNQATSAADIELGTQKAQQAQKHLDGLPVWFLGYYPQRYCTFFSCSWQFTLDQYQGARQQVARIEAKVFQEKNALTLLQQGESQVEQSKSKYQQAKSPSEKQEAIAAWQAGLDQLDRIPAQTLAGRMSQPQINAYQRDFQQAAGVVGSIQQTGTLITAAAQYGMAAAQLSQNPPHTVAEWEEIERLWQSGIQELQRVTPDNPAYVQAQQKLAEYKKNEAIARIRQEAEAQGTSALEKAKYQITRWQQSAGSGTAVSTLGSQLQSIIYELDQVPPGTTASQEATELKQLAEAKMKELGR